MPETRMPYVLRTWDDTEWINQVPEDLYPRVMPARFHLGTADGCQWDGPGFFYEPRGKSNEKIVLVKRVANTAAMKTAGNRPRPADTPTALYRLRDQAGALLYVGISVDPLRRWIEHSDDKHWWRNVSQFSINWLPSRRAALVAEAHAIKAERPIHNVLHNHRSQEV